MLAKAKLGAELLAAKAATQLTNAIFGRSKPRTVITHVNDGAYLHILRDREKSGSCVIDRIVRLGPNHVHAFIAHPDGTISNLGVSQNLLTNIGRDVFHQWIGGGIPAGGAGSPATATSATSFTSTGTPWTASNLATPQLGIAGFRAYFPVTDITTSPVYGNIISNTTSVATIDQWWTAADGVGTTPASTNAFILGAGGISSVRFMALTTNASAASAANTTLASEITTGGVARARATYAHAFGAATETLQKAYSVTGSFTSIHRMGLFAALSSAGADPMIFETVLNQDATVGNGDTLTVTDTITVSG
jgi:hypothetical protein